MSLDLVLIDQVEGLYDAVFLRCSSDMVQHLGLLLAVNLTRLGSLGR